MPENYSGLTSKEAEKKLQEFGPNVLPEKPPPSDLAILVSQVKNPLVYVLFAAGTVTLLLQHFADTLLIFSDVFLNSILGFFQERKADKALYALRKLVHPKAKVVRDGEIRTIDVEEVVPDDTCVITQGDKIPADGEVIFANRLFVNEAILTGESVSLAKKENDKLFMGTIVTSGQGKALIKTTGANTEIGKIALSIQKPEEETPLREQLTIFSKQLSILVGILILVVFFIGLATGRGIVEIVVTSIALAVSAIPEGLLVALTVVLAIGMQRILRRRGLVRNLVSAETLGGVTTICIDKTGTLTEGHMRVVDAIGNEENLTLQAIVANDMDDPIVIAAYEWASEKIPNSKFQIPNLKKRHERLDSIPFTSENRFFASLNKWEPKNNMLFVNGAPEFLLEWSNLSKNQKSNIKDQIEILTSEGKRLVGMARKKVSIEKSKLEVEDIKKNLEWLGMLALTDPVRDGVESALEKTKLAGIKLLVITGDYPQTAISVMRILGIEPDTDSVFLGSDLEKMTSGDLSQKLSKLTHSGLFARTTPNQKYKIVDALKKNGEVVAMMGDGVNDAPALKDADIGIVVGEASDVAKESSDLVLLDSNFATIIAAIEEGRGIFDNIRKIILYLMSDAFEEIVAVTGSIIVGVILRIPLPLPVSAAQILWINLVSDGFPDLALTLDPKVRGIMKKKPRAPSERIVTKWMKALIAIVSLVGGIIALVLFIYFYRKTGDLSLARSIAFATLGTNSLVYVFSIRTLRDSFWEENPFDNVWLDLAVVSGLLFQIAPFYITPLRQFLGLVPLSLMHWLIIFSVSILMFIIIEVSKEIFRIEHIE
ncbi:MAG: Cation-transporting ATPase [Candidatus Woesebacteria bacterium GW2011_GWB1_39_12]|uniref:Cation-transporting ATPase n=2 Tax=Candidatus Woeseibacteriota TaxID=1752722 RepID=A0A0G0Q972_9BACT|nr:MAG: Cation-transporting ATPase [Candidatus Woesebacteria bacterium GW2011_GWA1_39_12]KKR00306.1 MAG: Cation-transporting ATPase [Candidatus Woesebacteria bacterium GW2011_GWB1_39_12]